MLDGTPVTLRPQSTGSGGSRSPRFREHLSELEDTSSYPAPQHVPVRLYKRLSRLSTIADKGSPTLGKTATSAVNGNADPASETKQRQHLMSWNNYDEKHASSAPGESSAGGEAVTATMTTPKQPPNMQSAESEKHQVSPDLSSSPLDRSFIVSPMGSVDLGKSWRR